VPWLYTHYSANSHLAHKECNTSIFRVKFEPDDAGIKLLQKVVNDVQIDTAQHPKKLKLHKSLLLLIDV
jgi:hypothetical protein